MVIQLRIHMQIRYMVGFVHAFLFGCYITSIYKSSISTDILLFGQIIDFFLLIGF